MDYEIRLAISKDKKQLEKYDNHIHSNRLGECIYNNQVYVICSERRILGMLRYSLFWQTIPFLDLIFIDNSIRKQGQGTTLLLYWEHQMKLMGYRHVMTSTQSDETAWQFYEKLDYRKIGSFLPPEQNTDEWIYLKEL